MLNHLIEVQLDGEVADRDQAMAFLRNHYPPDNRQPA
jgi:hypothetical protein